MGKSMLVESIALSEVKIKSPEQRYNYTSIKHEYKVSFVTFRT